MLTRSAFWRLFVLFVLSINLIGINEAESAEPPAGFECRWAQTAPVIDGKLDDAAWKSAQLIDKFMLPWLQDKNRPAKPATRARLLWDREFLYFSADMDDSDL